MAKISQLKWLVEEIVYLCLWIRGNKWQNKGKSNGEERKAGTKRGNTYDEGQLRWIIWKSTIIEAL